MKTLELLHRENLYGYDEVKCPVCGNWNRGRTILFHISKKAQLGDKAHITFHRKHTKEFVVRKWKTQLV